MSDKVLIDKRNSLILKGGYFAHAYTPPVLQRGEQAAVR